MNGDNQTNIIPPRYWECESFIIDNLFPHVMLPCQNTVPLLYKTFGKFWKKWFPDFPLDEWTTDYPMNIVLEKHETRVLYLLELIFGALSLLHKDLNFWNDGLPSPFRADPNYRIWFVQMSSKMTVRSYRALLLGTTSGQTWVRNSDQHEVTCQLVTFVPILLALKFERYKSFGIN